MKILIKIFMIFKMNYKKKKLNRVHHKEVHFLKMINFIFIIKTF